MAPMNGTIKRLVSDKGFGFILASDGNDTSSTTPRARARASTTFAKDRRSPSSMGRARRVPAARTSDSPKRSGRADASGEGATSRTIAPRPARGRATSC